MFIIGDNTVDTYWQKMWCTSHSNDFTQYIKLDRDFEFVKILKEFHVKKVCDAACGFGKYSAILAKNNFQVSGFDIADHAVNMTMDHMKYFNLDYDQYRTCSITNINFEDHLFDAVIAHAVLDHLYIREIPRALSEINRITKSKGLIYLSFDGLSEEDLNDLHLVLPDGELYYLESGKEGMLFKYYSDAEIEVLLSDYEIIYHRKYASGERELIVQKRG